MERYNYVLPSKVMTAHDLPDLLSASITREKMRRTDLCLRVMAQWFIE